MGQFRVDVRDICSDRRGDALGTAQSLRCVFGRWPCHRVPSPSIRELSLWLSSTSRMLTRNCRWSRRTSRVRVPSVRSMSCWVSARDMSSLATPLIWRGQSGRPQGAGSGESPTPTGRSDCRPWVPPQPLQPGPAPTASPGWGCIPIPGCLPVGPHPAQRKQFSDANEVPPLAAGFPAARPGLQRPAQTLPEAQLYFDLGPALSFHAPERCWGARPQARCGAAISPRCSSFSHWIAGMKSLPFALAWLWPWLPAAMALAGPRVQTKHLPPPPQTPEASFHLTQPQHLSSPGRPLSWRGHARRQGTTRRGDSGTDAILPWQRDEPPSPAERRRAASPSQPGITGSWSPEPTRDPRNGWGAACSRAATPRSQPSARPLQ